MGTYTLRMRDRASEMAPEPTAAMREKAARALYEELERLDPSGEVSWDDLSVGMREMYRSCIDAVIPILGADARAN